MALYYQQKGSRWVFFFFFSSAVSYRRWERERKRERSVLNLVIPSPHPLITLAFSPHDLCHYRKPPTVFQARIDVLPPAKKTGRYRVARQSSEPRSKSYTSRSQNFCPWPPTLLSSSQHEAGWSATPKSTRWTCLNGAQPSSARPSFVAPDWESCLQTQLKCTNC